MTEKNTEIMRDAFRLLAAHETLPEELDEKWWRSLAADAAAMHTRWQGDRMAFHLADAIVSALSDQYAAKQKTEQLTMKI